MIMELEYPRLSCISVESKLLGCGRSSTGRLVRSCARAPGRQPSADLIGVQNVVFHGYANFQDQDNVP